MSHKHPWAYSGGEREGITGMTFTTTCAEAEAALQTERARSAKLVKAMERIASFASQFGPSDEALIAEAALAAYITRAALVTYIARAALDDYEEARDA
jgi:hypothetical protein